MNNDDRLADKMSLLEHVQVRAIVTCLIDGRYYTCRELAYMTQQDKSTVTTHLSTLIKDDIVDRNIHHGHSYYTVNDTHHRHLIHSYIDRLPTISNRQHKWPKSTMGITQARTCYSHLAGNLGVRLTTSMLASGYIKDEFDQFYVTPKGEHFFADFGLCIPRIKHHGNPLAKKCLDMSERRYHVGGSLGRELANKLFSDNWIKHIQNSRAIRITDKGKIKLRETFSLNT